MLDTTLLSQRSLASFVTITIERYPKSNICVVVLSNEEEVKSWELSASLAGLLLNQQ